MTHAAEEIAAQLDAADSKEGEPSPRSWGFDVEVINSDHALVLMGSKAVVIKERNVGPIESRLQILSIDAFRQWFANKSTEIVTADGKTKSVTWGHAWLSHKSRRQFDGVEFFPNPDGAEGTPGYLNFWRGFSVSPSERGKYDIFRDHLLNNVCGGDENLFRYVFGWFAHMIQKPRERIGTAIVLRGRMGSGKSKVGEVFGSLISAHYFQVDDPRYIVGQFNAHMSKCLLLQAEEAVWAGDKQAEGRLKGLITSTCHMIESKGIDPIRVDNFVRVLMTSNEDWVVPAGKDERRFCVLDVSPRCAQNNDYFREMDAELNAGGRERLLYDLQQFDLSELELRCAPRTAALFEQKLRSLEPIDSWWYSRLVDGAALRGDDEWPALVPAESLYKDYLRAADETGVGRKRDPATFGLRLGKLCPGIEKQRPRAKTDSQARRIYCYALPALEQCRAAFEELIGQEIVWPLAVESEAAASTPADEEIPV